MIMSLFLLSSDLSLGDFYLIFMISLIFIIVHKYFMSSSISSHFKIVYEMLKLNIIFTFSIMIINVRNGIDDASSNPPLCFTLFLRKARIHLFPSRISVSKAGSMGERIEFNAVLNLKVANDESCLREKDWGKQVWVLSVTVLVEGNEFSYAVSNYRQGYLCFNSAYALGICQNPLVPLQAIGKY